MPTKTKKRTVRMRRRHDFYYWDRDGFMSLGQVRAEFGDVVELPVKGKKVK